MADLDGKRVAVLIESEYIPEEIAAYQRVFSERGATVDLISRLWGNPAVTFVSDVDRVEKPLETLTVNIDIESVNVEDYDVVIMCANYTSVRLRYFEPSSPVGPETDWRELVRSPPAVKFFARAMADATIIKGALCHGLWLLAPHPELLKGRRVSCHRVVLADVLNAGGVYDPAEVVVDNDLVTGDSGSHVLAFIEAICQKLIAVR